jgi:TRAP-type mannitol/chloroaromatic compound transport system substrate-binding protein
MERREFIKTLGLMAGGLAVADMIKPVNVQAKKRVRWRLVTSWPQSLDTIHGGALTIARVVRELTNGYFDIRVYSGGELVPALKVLDYSSKLVQ